MVAAEPVLPFIVAAAMLLLLFAPLIVDERRKRRGEARYHHPAAVTAVSVLVFAAFVAVMATSTNAIAWGVAASAVSLLALWSALLAMLSRGKPAAAHRAAPDDAGDARRPSDDPPAPDAAPAHRAIPRLETAAQIAGILSLVVSLIALAVR